MMQTALLRSTRRSGRGGGCDIFCVSAGRVAGQGEGGGPPFGGFAVVVCSMLVYAVLCLLCVCECVDIALLLLLGQGSRDGAAAGCALARTNRPHPERAPPRGRSPPPPSLCSVHGGPALTQAQLLVASLPL
jgi:hypothetical protein